MSQGNMTKAQKKILASAVMSELQKQQTAQIETLS